HWKIGQVIDYLRSTADLPTDFWEVFVVDATHHPVGTCKLSTILRTARDRSVSEMMVRDQTLITVDDVVHIIQGEAGEDVLLLSGAGEGDINEPVPLTVRRRLFWLVINLGTAMIAASVVS